MSSLYAFVGLAIYFCVFCVYLYMHESLCVEARSWGWLFSSITFHLGFWDSNSLNLELAGWLSWLVNEPQGPLAATFPLGDYRHTPMDPAFWLGCWRFELMVSCLLDQHVADWAISSSFHFLKCESVLSRDLGSALCQGLTGSSSL